MHPTLSKHFQAYLRGCSFGSSGVLAACPPGHDFEDNLHRAEHEVGLELALLGYCYGSRSMAKIPRLAATTRLAKLGTADAIARRPSAKLFDCLLLNFKTQHRPLEAHYIGTVLSYLAGALGDRYMVSLLMAIDGQEKRMRAVYYHLWVNGRERALKYYDGLFRSQAESIKAQTYRGFHAYPPRNERERGPLCDLLAGRLALETEPKTKAPLIKAMVKGCPRKQKQLLDLIRKLHDQGQLDSEVLHALDDVGSQHIDQALATARHVYGGSWRYDRSMAIALGWIAKKRPTLARSLASATRQALRDGKRKDTVVGLATRKQIKIILGGDAVNDPNLTTGSYH